MTWEGLVIPVSRVLATLAIPAAWLSPISVLAQANTETPVVSQQEAEAHQMSLTLAVGCSPRRHNSVAGSESSIERDPEPLVGTAAFYSNIEGTFVVLEEYDE